MIHNIHWLASVPSVDDWYQVLPEEYVGPMSATFKIVDLFAGPGGLAEGFAAFRDDTGKAPFKIALSVEMEANAFQTLRLRSFFRQFETAPQEYYDYVAGRVDKSALVAAHASEWNAAVTETKQLTLGTEDAKLAIDPILDKLRSGTDPTILIGGPPCQAYSLVGRSRNRGIEGYDPAKDHRHFLYREYIRIIQRLQPAAFVMENVKGILSSKVGGDLIFHRVLKDLKEAGGAEESYTLLPLVKAERGRGSGFIVRCEDFGIPQCRHRVIIVGVRTDLLDKEMSQLAFAGLEPFIQATPASTVLKAMPKLRSGLTPAREDNAENWTEAAVQGMRKAADAARAAGQSLEEVATLLESIAEETAADVKGFPRKSSELAKIKDNRLGAWLADPNLDTLPNHETRGHMRDDLARYAFVSAFGSIFGRSPKANEFPSDLAPDHANWKTGKFADRFRVQLWDRPSTTVTSHISKDGHAFIHPDPAQCRSLTVREAARLQTFPDNYFFEGGRTAQFTQVGNAVPPLLAQQIAAVLHSLIGSHSVDNEDEPQNDGTAREVEST
ncbi:MAG: DNA cytosine methyltransferase [Qipengyuania sp.]|uniref:DNA cytosine methyltransferase n=1 Tax=Qipengyuania sp. TaxID=2004515 RepID=UPI0030026B47